MTANDTNDLQKEADDMVAKASAEFGRQFSNAFNEQMEKLNIMSYSRMQSGDIAIRIGETVYETDVKTVALTAIVGGAVGYITYKAVTAWL